MLSGLSEDEAEVIKRVIKKDLRVGVNAKTVNKVIPGLIPSFPCMLASPYTKKNLDKIKFPAIAQEKLDGMRVNIIVARGKVSYRSRNGKLIELHSHSNAIFTNMAKITGDGVFDGEMLVERDGVILDRKTGNGILNKSVRKTITAEEAAMVKFVLWDFIPIKDFKNNVCAIPYYKRYSTLVKTMKLMNSKIVSIVNTQQADNQQHANDIFNEYLSKGSEGVILKNSEGPWEDKRATHQVKMKAELDADLKVISWVEGSGRLAGKMGSLICESEDGGLRVAVGSGFNDEQRESITPAEVIGKIITVKYNEKIKSKSKNENSLFLPIFVEFREDKDIANIDSEIK
jgi:ATP-dependent DNA ligase